MDSRPRPRGGPPGGPVAIPAAPAFVRRQRRLVVVVSAWDVVLERRPSPEQWLERERPFLHQFLTNNPESFAYRVYGVSAQGGDVTGDQRSELVRQTPSERIQC